MTTFTISEQDKKKIQEWKKTLPRPDVVGTIGDRFAYSFTPTGLGVMVTVKDFLSGQVLDLTDYDSW